MDEDSTLVIRNDVGIPSIRLTVYRHIPDGCHTIHSRDALSRRAARDQVAAPSFFAALVRVASILLSSLACLLKALVRTPLWARVKSSVGPTGTGRSL
jgi:hypothetical protein